MQSQPIHARTSYISHQKRNTTWGELGAGQLQITHPEQTQNNEASTGWTSIVRGSQEYKSGGGGRTKEGEKGVLYL